MAPAIGVPASAPIAAKVITIPVRRPMSPVPPRENMGVIKQLTYVPTACLFEDAKKKTKGKTAQQTSLTRNGCAALPVQSGDNDEPWFGAHKWPDERHHSPKDRHGSHEVDSAYTYNVEVIMKRATHVWIS